MAPLLCFMATNTSALTFPMPAAGNDIVGEVLTTIAVQGESLGDIGRRFDIGVSEMIEANPGLDPWVPIAGSTVIIPGQFILPPGERTGVVLNLAEMRVYFYHPDKKFVSTFPVGIGKGKEGKEGWSTPLGQTKIIAKKKDPAWHPPASIRQEHLERGDVLPDVVPAGPDNPLGRYAMYTGIKSVLMHGSNRPAGVGVRSSHGCIRLLPEDIETLFNLVPIGTSFKIIHEPFKLGWYNKSLYLEAHHPLSEPKYKGSNSLTHLAEMIESTKDASYFVNWSSARQVTVASNGYPAKID